MVLNTVYVRARAGKAHASLAKPDHFIYDMVVLKAECIVLPGGKLRTGPLYVVVEGQKIASIQEQASGLPDEVINTHLLTPGFIDLHTHGLGE